MIPVLVSGLMWLLVAALLVLRRGRADRTITYSAVTIALAMTLNIDAVYVGVDGLLGGTNLVTLIADLALMVGIFFLGRGVAKAADHRSRVVRVALGRGILAVALVGVIVAFLLIDRGETTTTFMLDFGAQPAAAVYSILQFTYDGIVVATMAAVVVGQVARTHGHEQLPALSLLVGSLLGMLLSVVVIVMDVAHLAGNLPTMRALGVIYGPLFALTFLFLCLGLAGQPAVRWVRERSRVVTTRELVDRVTPIWERASSARPGIGAMDLASSGTDGSEARLHRQVVEIRDALIDPRVTFELTNAEGDVVDGAEAHLLGTAALAEVDAGRAQDVR